MPYLSHDIIHKQTTNHKCEFTQPRAEFSPETSEEGGRCANTKWAHHGADKVILRVSSDKALLAAMVHFCV